MVVGDTDFVRVILTTLGGNQNSTIGALVAVECHSSSILQDTYMVNLLRADNIHVALNTVHQYEWCIGAQALQATNVERGVLLEVGS